MMLRAFFAGIGRILLAADRPQAHPAPQDGGSSGRSGAGPHGSTGGNRQPAGPDSTVRWRSLDQTGNVRLLTPSDLDADYSGRRLDAVAGQPSSGRDAGRGSAKPQGFPLANYDDLSIASLRARLRNLDGSQLRALADYERDNARRSDVLGMFERRIRKLEADG